MTATRLQDLPKTFRSLATLRILNVLAVGASLAAATGAVFGWVFGRPFATDPTLSDPSFEGRVASLTALSTFLFGIVWAIVLRSRSTLGRSKLRRGWVLSIPLAIANAATACGLLFVSEHQSRHVLRDLVSGAVVGATFGVICWLPGLVMTLLAFGVPISWSQQLATKGLAGEERGELVVGAVSAAIACAAAALLLPARDVPLDAVGSATAIGQVTVMLFAVLGASAGSLAAVSSVRRERVRRTFVRRVEAGDVPGYRVDETAEGKVLVRVTSMGAGYRVANFEEPLFGLDETGEARRSLELRR